MNKLKEFNLFLKQETLKKYAVMFCVFLVISMLLEVFVFNFRSIESVFNQEYDYGDVRVVSGGTKTGDGVYKATGDTISFEITGINKYIRNVHLDVAVGSDKKTKTVISMKDEGNISYYSSHEWYVVPGVERSQYIRIHPSGDLKSLKIDIAAGNGKIVKLNDLGLNVKVPLMFSFWRFFFVGLVLWLLYLLRPKSSVYKYKINFKSMRQRAVILVLVVIQVITFFGIANLNPFFKNPTRHYYDQYHELTDALLSGHVYLNQHQVSDNLKSLDDPYDLGQRYSALSRDNGGKAWDYEWDHAYFNEKIYVYFGVAPVITMYIPYKLITGKQLPDHMAIFFISVLLILAIMLLLYEVIKKWFPNTPLALYLIISCLFINSCGIIYALQRPDLYSVPVTMSVMFGVLGIALWIKSLKTDEMGNTKISPLWLTLGSLCVACTSGCRPQTLLIIALGVVLYWNCVFKDRTLFSKTSIKTTTCLVAPFVVIGALIMAYNFARFGSPFDFGANYNLTNNDMRQRGFVFDRSLSGLFYYLFAPVGIKGFFPFVSRMDIETTYQGKVISEAMFGAFPANPILWINFLVFAFRKQLKDKKLFAFTLVSLIISVILCVLAAQVAAIYLRYLTDFSWLLFVAAAIMVFVVYENMATQKAKQWFMTAVLICFVLGMTFHGLWIFTDISDNLCDLIPQWWYNMQHLIAFWM